MASARIQHTLAESEDVELVEIDRNATSRHVTRCSTGDIGPFNSARQLEEGQVGTTEVGEDESKGSDNGNGGSTGEADKQRTPFFFNNDSFPTLKQQFAEDDSYNIDNTPTITDDTRLPLNPNSYHEHRHYLTKKLQRLQEAARSHRICKTIIPEQCRIHGSLFGDVDSFLELRSSHDFSSVSFYSSVEGMFANPEAGLCGTVHTEEDLAKLERQVVKEREKDQATVHCIECAGAIVLLVFLIVSLALYASIQHDSHCKLAR